MAVLVSERGQEENLLSLRGAEPGSIRAAARRLSVPADTIVEVGSEVGPLAAAMAPLREQVGATTGSSV